MPTKKITLSFKTSDGELNPVSFEVEDGKSAYEIWLSLGNTGSEEDFINSLGSSENTTHLVSSKTNPVDINKLEAGTYLIEEADGGYTILNAPNFSTRTQPIWVQISPNTNVKLAMFDSKFQMKLGNGFWTDILSGDQTLVYQKGALQGLYWSDGSGIWGKKGDTLVLGTEDSPSNSLVIKIKNPISNPDSLTGISQFINTKGDFKVFVGGEDSSNKTPNPNKLFTVPTLSETDKNSLLLAKVDPTDLTITDLADKYNRLVDLIVKSGLGKLE